MFVMQVIHRIREPGCIRPVTTDRSILVYISAGTQSPFKGVREKSPLATIAQPYEQILHSN
jgi:hypothetical protein